MPDAEYCAELLAKKPSAEAMVAAAAASPPKPSTTVARCASTALYLHSCVQSDSNSQKHL